MSKEITPVESTAIIASSGGQNANNSIATALLQVSDGEVNACSFQPTNMEERKLIYNAIQGATRLKDELGKPFKLQNVYMQSHTFIEEDGTESDGTRVILIDENMAGYATAAEGVVNSLKTLVAVFGDFPWAEPVEVVPQLEKGKRGDILKLHCV